MPKIEQIRSTRRAGVPGARSATVVGRLKATDRRRAYATTAVLRDVRTGRFTTRRSERTISRNAVRFAPALKRLAEK
jgi:hypothetical protein